MADSQSKEDPEPGAPVPEGLDPELIKLPYARTRVRPILALTIILLCLVLLWRLWDDLSFSRQGDAIQLSSLEELAGHENDHVEFLAPPDRPQAVRLVPSGGTTGQVLMPVLGTAGKLWILVPATPWAEAPRHNERYTGRLLRMGDMRFYEELQAHLKNAKIVPRPVPMAEVRGALQEGAALHDAAGDLLSPEPSTPVRILEVSATHVEVLAYGTDSYPDEARWSLALRNAGLLTADMGPVTSAPNSWTYHIATSAGVDEVGKRLSEAKLFGARVSELANTREGLWSELRIADEGVVLGETQPGYSVRSVALALPHPLSSDSFLLDATDSPEGYWYITLLALVLVLCALLFAFGIYRNTRP